MSEPAPEEEEVSLEEADDEEIKSCLEAALFVAEEPLRASDLSDPLGVDGNRLRRLLKQLQEEYRLDDRGMQVLTISGGFKLTTRERHYPYLKRMFGERTRARLSDSAVETLVIVAYHQPVTRPEVEAVRGVNSQSVLKTLLEENLIRISGRRDEIGRPMEYKTTDRFLDYFGLSSLNDLPDQDEIQQLIDET